MSDLEDTSEDFNGLFATLGEDVHRAVAAAHDVGDQYSYRQFVRAAFAMQEGLTYAIKQMALAVDDDEHILTPQERAFLSEVSYDLDERGELKERPAALAMLRNIRFAFKSHSKVHQSGYVLPVGEAGWEKLGKATAIRNRLTHPKGSRDVNVEADEVEIVRYAHVWFARQALALIEAAARADAARSEYLERELAVLQQHKALAAKALVLLRAEMRSSEGQRANTEGLTNGSSNQD